MSAAGFELSLPATAENVIVVRQAIAGVAEALGLAGPRIADLKTVVTEACNNVVLHAYESESGPLLVSAEPRDNELIVEIGDEGHGFRPRAHDGDPSLGLGLPLIAALSDSFEISGGAGRGSTTRIRFGYAPPEAANNGQPAMAPKELEIALTPGAIVRPVLARIMGALAARAEFSVDRLADTVLLGDAVSASEGGEFAGGRVVVAIKDGVGTLVVRVGPLVAGGGERLMSEMEVPGAGSLRSLATNMEVTQGEGPGGETAEFLEFEVTQTQ
jgi:serine/threonine-protein kinase RsbW